MDILIGIIGIVALPFPFLILMIVERIVEHFDWHPKLGQKLQGNNNSIEKSEYNNIQAQQSRMGIAGFILSLIAIYLSYTPIFGKIIWLLGAVLSTIGFYKSENRGFAFAGILLSYLIYVVYIGSLLMIYFPPDPSIHY